MDKNYYYISIQYEGESINFGTFLPKDTDIKQFEEKLRKEIYISIERKEK